MWLRYAPNRTVLFSCAGRYDSAGRTIASFGVEPAPGGAEVERHPVRHALTLAIDSGLREIRRGGAD